VTKAQDFTIELTSQKHFCSSIDTGVFLFAYNRKQQYVTYLKDLVVHKTTESYMKEMYYPKPASKQLSYNDV
jgi:hypothetical protein